MRDILQYQQRMHEDHHYSKHAMPKFRFKMNPFHMSSSILVNWFWTFFVRSAVCFFGWTDQVPPSSLTISNGPNGLWDNFGEYFNTFGNNSIVCWPGITECCLEGKGCNLLYQNLQWQMAAHIENVMPMLWFMQIRWWRVFVLQISRIRTTVTYYHGGLAQTFLFWYEMVVCTAAKPHFFCQIGT